MSSLWPAFWMLDEQRQRLLDRRYGLLRVEYGQPLATMARRSRLSESEIRARIDAALAHCIDAGHLARSWKKWTRAQEVRTPKEPDGDFEEWLTWAWPHLHGLTPREEMMFRLRWGFEGRPLTLDQVGAYFMVSGERARQILRGANAKLSDPTWHARLVALAAP